MALIPTIQRPTPKTHQLTLSWLVFSISSYLVYKVLSTAESFSRFRWQSLPTDEAVFREEEPSYDEAHTLCDPGWQSQPM